MKYKDTVIKEFINYPWTNRLYVDDLLFATIGNGYKWLNGQLVYVYGYVWGFENIECKNDYTSKYDMYSERYNNYDVNVNCVFNPEFNEMGEKEKNDYVVSILNSSCKDTRYNRQWYVYPFSEKHSALANIPDDIQSDWLDTIEQFVDFLLEHPEYVSDPRHDNTNDWTKSEAAKRPEILRKAKERINQLRNKQHEN